MKELPLCGNSSDPRVRELTKNFVTVFGDGKSLGLGSQVSQICAIFYPDRLDHYIKEKLRIKYYGRYMDDMYLIHESREYLKECLKIITELCAKLKITVSMKKTRIVKLKDGIDFPKGKYVLLEPGKILRLPGKDSSKRMRRKLKKFKTLVDAGETGRDDLRCAYQSWRGNYRRRFNAYHRVRNMDRLYHNLFIKIYPQEGIMVYFWKKNGQVYRHAAETGAAAMKAAKQMDGLSGQPEAEASDEEFEAGGCLARLIGGSIATGKTEDGKQLEQNAGRLRVLKRQLADTDYIAVKIAEGAATAQDYAAKIAKRQAWRAETGLLEKALQTA
jgi:hypothetical protein